MDDAAFDAFMAPIHAAAARREDRIACCNCRSVDGMTWADMTPEYFPSVGPVAMDESVTYGRCRRHNKNVVAHDWCKAFEPQQEIRLGGPRESPQPNPHCDTETT